MKYAGSNFLFMNHCLSLLFHSVSTAEFISVGNGASLTHTYTHTHTHTSLILGANYPRTHKWKVCECVVVKRSESKLKAVMGSAAFAYTEKPSIYFPEIKM